MHKWLFAAILILAFSLRLPGLSTYPVGFTPDEASFGYDAYSILKTGKDQWGEFLPVVLKSFGDYKAPLMSYLTIPFVATLGLTKTMIRLPNAILSFLSVIAVYFLAGELGRITKFEEVKIRTLKLLSAFIVAVSPWHVMLSRGAFEANLTTFFMPAGVLFFLLGLKNSKYLFLSSIFFGLNLFTYHSARFVTPFIVLALVVLFWKKLRMLAKRVVLPFFIFLVFSSLALFSFTQGAGSRAKEISVLSGAAEDAAGERLAALQGGTPFILAKGLHNKYQIALKRFINNYSQYTSYNFLFKSGPAEGTYGMIPGRGVLYWTDIFLIVGAVIAFFKIKSKKAMSFLAVWFLVGIIPAALTMGRGYAANRAGVVLPAIPLILAFGTVAMFNSLSAINVRLAKVTGLIFGVIFLMLFISFLEDYFILSPRKTAKDMLYGNLEVAGWAATQNENMVVSTGLSEPHIYAAFANSWDPRDYQKNTEEWDMETSGVSWVDQLPEYRLGKYVFKKIDLKENSASQDILIGRPREFPDGIIPELKIVYPDGEPAIFVVAPEDIRFAQTK